jgi:membrane-bound lytic murein transglycosylase A
MMMRLSLRSGLGLSVLALLAACHAPMQRPSPTTPEVVPPPLLKYEASSWSNLPGWASDDTRAAWPALLVSCRSTRLAAVWGSFCTAAQGIGAQDAVAQRALVESRLRPWRITTLSQDGKRERAERGIVTGYYEPMLNGSRLRTNVFKTPLYGVPDDLVTIELGDLYPQLKGERLRGRLQGKRVTPYPDRAQLADGKLLNGKELVWVDDPVDAFFLQIQGSGRVRFPDGSMVRLAFADVNGQPYRAIGRYLVDKGELTVQESALPNLKQWLATHPDRVDEVFNFNPSVVFFREEQIADPAQGPKGAMGLPLTPGRSIAIDPRQLPLGAPLFLSTAHPLTHAPLQRMVMGQDTGGAIRGAIRADFFWGFGHEAGEVAGAMREQGLMWLLWPVDQPLPVPGS